MHDEVRAELTDRLKTLNKRARNARRNAADLQAELDKKIAEAEDFEQLAARFAATLRELPESHAAWVKRYLGGRYPAFPGDMLEDYDPNSDYAPIDPSRRITIVG